MSILKYIDRLKRMDEMIRKKSTGSADEFAHKMNMSKSQLFQNLKEMKQLGAPIDYCAYRKSYFYESECKLTINFLKEGQSIKGGNIFIC